MVKWLINGLDTLLFAIITLILILNGITGWAIVFFILTVLTLL